MFGDVVANLSHRAHESVNERRWETGRECGLVGLYSESGPAIVVRSSGKLTIEGAKRASLRGYPLINAIRGRSQEWFAFRYAEPGGGQRRGEKT
jgi:hypothetical protein